jgi:hypothetical protein
MAPRERSHPQTFADPSPHVDHLGRILDRVTALPGWDYLSVDEKVALFDAAARAYFEQHIEPFALSVASVRRIATALLGARLKRADIAGRAGWLMTIDRMRATLASRSGRGSPPTQGPSALPGEANMVATTPPDEAPHRASQTSRRGPTSYPAANSPCREPLRGVGA